jgi:hypothetical protein
MLNLIKEFNRINKLSNKNCIKNILMKNNFLKRWYNGCYWYGFYYKLQKLTLDYKQLERDFQ